MNLSELIMSIQLLAPQLASMCCIVNGTLMTLEEIENMGYDEFSYRSKINMPLKLYKYFPNKEITGNDGNKVNYSLLALKNNTVYMQSPSLFDDVYDSEINIDYDEYRKYRLMEYCRRCGLTIDADKTIEEIGSELLKAISKSVKTNKDFNHIFVVNPISIIESMSNKIFINKIKIGLAENPDIGQIVSKIILEEYQAYIQELKNTFRISCFATTPFSQLMWGGAYADCHNGFCVEYTVLPNDKKYKELYYNLFPMVYCKTRPNITKKLVEWEDKNKTKEYLWDIYYHGALRKSVDWAFQNEWRLLLPMNQKKSDYNISFFPITRVYLGNRMKVDKRKEIINYCNSKEIPYVGVCRNPNVFEMQACAMKCENCDNYK